MLYVMFILSEDVFFRCTTFSLRNQSADTATVLAVKEGQTHSTTKAEKKIEKLKRKFKSQRHQFNHL